jgi:thiamine transporter
MSLMGFIWGAGQYPAERTVKDGRPIEPDPDNAGVGRKQEMSKFSSNTKIIAEATVIIALTVILEDALPPIFRLPQGGSVSVASMVPLLWFSLRRGLRSGLEASAIYGLIHMALPGSYIIDPVQGLLDYPIAYASLGLAGLFKKHPLLGVGVGITGRFLAHLVSGVWFFSQYAGAMHPLLYSAIYNGSFLFIEFLISAIIIYILAKRKLLEIYL